MGKTRGALAKRRTYTYSCHSHLCRSYTSLPHYLYTLQSKGKTLKGTSSVYDGAQKLKENGLDSALIVSVVETYLSLSRP